MAYFPHAYQKMLVGVNGFTSVAGHSVTLETQPGKIAVVDSKTNQIQNQAAAPAAGVSQVYLAQGSFHTTDKLGPFHGGYKESVKSKGINAKYISAFYVTEPAPAVNQIVTVNADGCTIPCNTTYRLRLDVKGSPALRFLTHNIYTTVDGFSGCCNADSDAVDVNVILLQWKDAINASPIVKDFVNAKVWNATSTAIAADTTSASATIVVANADKALFVVGNKVTGTGIPDNTTVVSVGANDSAGAGLANVVLSNAATATAADVPVTIFASIDSDTYVAETVEADIAAVNAHLELTGAYVGTEFGDCSFEPTDHYEIEPVKIYPSFVGETGDPCEVICFSVAETQEAYQGKGYGETLVRELILSKRYAQEDWSCDARLREVLHNTTLTELSRSSKYYVYHILHSVPRKSNPSGTMDSDQYLVKVVATARDANFESYIGALLANANSDVEFEVVL